jgi:hypothetical protein
MTPRDVLLAAGPLLFGTNWHRQVADALCVSERSVQRWAAPEGDPPPGIVAELQRLAEARQQHISALLDRLA